MMVIMKTELVYVCDNNWLYDSMEPNRQVCVTRRLDTFHSWPILIHSTNDMVGVSLFLSISMVSVTRTKISKYIAHAHAANQNQKKSFVPDKLF